MALGKSERSSAPGQLPGFKGFTFWPVLAVLAVGVTLAGYVYYSAQRRFILDEVRDQLQTVLVSKVNELAVWRREQLAKATALATSLGNQTTVQALEGRPAPARVRDVEHWMNSLREASGFEFLSLTDSSGALLATAGPRPKAGNGLQSAVSRVIASGRPEFQPFHFEDGGAEVQLRLTVPVSLPRGKRSALVAGIASTGTLLPLIAGWPTPRSTAEILLARRDGDDVYYLSAGSRDRPAPLLMRRRTSRNEFASMFPASNALTSEIDYRGEPVLALSALVPDSNWLVIAKIDRAELEGPLRNRALGLALAGAGLIGLVWLWFAILWRAREAALYKERYAAELRQRALERHYAFFYEQANDAILLLNAEFVVIQANERCACMYGYSKEELIGIRMKAFRAPECSEEFDGDWKRVAEAGSLVFETVHRRRDGSTFPVEVSACVLELEDRCYFQSIVRDITERKAAEEAIRDSEARFRSSFEQAAVGMALAGPDGALLRINQRFCEMLGRTEDELRRMNLGEAIATPSHADELDQYHQFASGNLDTYTREKRYRREDGSVVWVNLTMSLVRSGRGDPLYVLAVAEDISARKRTEEQLLQAQKMESIGRLAGGVAHDFNNHLTVINGYCDLLLEDASGSGFEVQALMAIRDSGERAAALTRQLLLFSRKQVTQPKRVNLNAVISDTERMLRRLIGEDVELVTDLRAELPDIVADPTQINQILMNLAVNARDAMPSGGTIRIYTESETIANGDNAASPDRSPGLYAILGFSDTGVGIPPDVKDRIFEPFFTTKKEGAGTGLGLSTVYGIVRQAGGWIEVDSTPGLGTRFRLYFRAAGAEVPRTRSQHAAARAVNGSGTVLVVEDHEDLLRLISEILKDHGYTVITARGGEEAVKLAAALPKSADLVLTDVIMPGMTGPELAMRLASLWPGVRTLFMSGYPGTEAIAVQAVDGDREYLAKPFSAEQLTAKVRAAMGRPT